MHFDPNQVFPILIPLVIIGVLVIRRRKPQRIRIERLWIMPVLMTAFIGSGLYYTPHAAFHPLTYAAFAIALAVGLIAGWFRARTVPMSFDAASGTVVTEPSIVAIVVLVALFAGRSLLRMALVGSATGIDAGTISDGFLLFAVGLIVGGRIEMFVRGQRLIRSGTAVAMPS
ncbi:cytochrome c biogenesis protein CcdC [Polymorphobacter sp. PAMC 29334]|uniref:CcdC protein domain-containing protein n=1 Tax=Polymorphobacter sp. PAMC 29334 TaxID=2862331 RepID=UPI001C66A8D3|nr:CcdC protein domain-containing protein [Polymorphobacter sp. PAMC 29334]QYE35590.1 cytochrome c biogenesis protein CcdC [Polymorphobacter sp. PAMC 29334]